MKSRFPLISLLACSLLLLTACAAPTPPPQPVMTPVPPTATPIPPTPTPIPEPDLTQTDLWAAGFTTVTNNAERFVVRKGDVILDLSLLATAGDPEVPPALNPLRLIERLDAGFTWEERLTLRLTLDAEAGRHAYLLDAGALIASATGDVYAAGSALFPTADALIPAAPLDEADRVGWARDGALALEQLRLAQDAAGAPVWAVLARAEPPAWAWEAPAAPSTYPLTAEELETIAALLESEATSIPPSRLFETAPLTLQEVAEIFDLARHTEVMSGTAHTGAQVHILVDFTQVGPNGAPIVPPQYRLSRIDYMPDGPDGQPNNDAVAQYNVEAMASMQRQANAIGRDGRAAPSTAPEPGEEEISVVNIAELSGQEGRLAPELQRVILPVDDPSITHYYSIRRYSVLGDNDPAGHVVLENGAEVRLHMHGGATGSNTYSGVFLAELENGERALITIYTIPFNSLDQDPILFMASLFDTGVYAVMLNSVHPNYVDGHYVAVGKPNAPITTGDIDDIRVLSRDTTLNANQDIIPNLVGHP